MDVLLQHAQQLADKDHSPLLLPIDGRIAYVVSHGQSYASNGYAIRAQGIAKALNDHGFDTLCLVRPGRPWELGATQVEPEVIVDGVRYIHSRWPNNISPRGEQARLEASVEKIIELFKVYRPSIVVAASNYIVGLPAWIAAKRLGLPFYNEVRGFWELSRSAREPGYENTPAFKAERERDIFVAQQALKVFTLNQPMREELVRRGVESQRIDIVPNGVSKLPMIQSADQDLKCRLGIEPGDRVVGYVGSFSPYEGLDTLVEACNQLVEQGQRIKLLLVGDDQPLDDLVKSEKKFGDQPWLIQVGRVNHDQVSDYYALIDLVVIARKKLRVCELVPPMKAIEALVYGKRLLVSDLTPLTDYAEKYREAVTFEAGRAESLALALQTSLAMPSPKAGASVLMAAHTDLMARVLNEKNAEPKATQYKYKPSGQSKSAAPLSDETIRIEPRVLSLSINSKQAIAEINVPTPSATLELSAAVVYQLHSAITSRKAVLLFDFFNKEGNKKAIIPGLGVAAAFSQHFRYLNSNSKTIDDTMQEVFKLKLPDDITNVRVAVGSLGLKADEHIDIRIQGRCYSGAAEKECKQKSLPAVIVHDPAQKRYTSDLIVACVLDEFTAECLSHEVTLIRVTQEAWRSQLEQNPPDFLLVESCWKGNDGNWGTVTKGSGGGRKLGNLLRYCKLQGIPTVFWNKEDPPHYEKFGPIAKLFDLAITTDVNMVPRYMEDFGIDVFPLSFAAQPKIHNPEPIIPRLEKAVFAGSYYGDKPKRCTDFNEVMEQCEKAGVQYDIFDRNYQKNIKKFAFPDHYQANIVGNLLPEEVWKTYKGYKYQVNMNSVQDSATMFARRVYESLASGTPVISNESVGVRELFGDVVIMSNDDRNIAEQLRDLEASPTAYKNLARRGVRRVMREHTYGHRIQTICLLLGIDIEVALPEATLAFTAGSEVEVQRARKLFAAQTAPGKQLFIELENFDTAYQFLNDSDDTTTFAMQLAKELYVDEQSFYGTDFVLKCNVNDELAAEVLEDFIYWREAG